MSKTAAQWNATPKFQGVRLLGGRFPAPKDGVRPLLPDAVDRIAVAFDTEAVATIAGGRGQ